MKVLPCHTQLALLSIDGALADVRRIALSGAEAEFQKTGLLDETPQRSAGLRAVHALLHRAHCKGGIDMVTWNELVPNPQVCAALRCASVCAYGICCHVSHAKVQFWQQTPVLVGKLSQVMV